MSLLTFTVPGKPAPQGSKRHVGRGVLVESSPGLKPWREAITWAALDAAREQGWKSNDEAVEVGLTFCLARPKTAPKSRVHPTTRPDADKLARAALDALARAVIRDDSLVVALHVWKVYTTGMPRLDVYVATMTAETEG